MTFSNVNALDLLGKQVSFNSSLGDVTFFNRGVVISVIVNLSDSPEIFIEDGLGSYSLSEITDLKVF